MHAQEKTSEKDEVYYAIHGISGNRIITSNGTVFDKNGAKERHNFSSDGYAIVIDKNEDAWTKSGENIYRYKNHPDIKRRNLENRQYHFNVLPGPTEKSGSAPKTSYTNPKDSIIFYRKKIRFFTNFQTTILWLPACSKAGMMFYGWEPEPAFTNSI
ncbi:hypothetical protein [Flavobacterium sp. 3HN19-14]|uniref:hypothetical protein n=1 Tax=Flavobacterium sp. 3HN19-14 TaxID=3448133 RepID=UPI003EE0CC6F